MKAGSDVKVQAKKTDADINDLATPRIRVRNKEKAKFLVGDRLPVISTASVPGSTSTTPIQNTSVQYVEVGIKIEVEPTIYADGEVAIRLSLEVSSAGDPNPEAAKSGTIAFSISTRTVSTVLRLKDGQTEVLGGLIRDEDRSNATRVPGFGDIPILGRLFGIQTDTKNKKEIIMSITPRIIRNSRQVDSDLLELWSGTENNMRFGARQVGSPKLQATAAAAVSPSAPATVAPASPTPNVPAAANAPTLVSPAVAPTPATGQSTPFTPPAQAAPRVVAPTSVASRALPQATKQATVLPFSSTVSVAKAAALRPLTVVAPQNAVVGEMINVTVSYPPLVAATNLESTITFDADRLRLVNVVDADSTKNATEGIRFTGEADGSSAARIELSAGRGETLPANGGPLARLQFEVLTPTGPTQLAVDRSAFVSIENGSQPLPAVPPVELDVKPK